MELTVTHVLQYLYCPRFTYYEHMLMVPQRQERRWKVRRGREVHAERQKVNPTYLRKKIGVVKRQFDVPLSSESLGLHGIADEVLTLADGTLAPLDYKFTTKPRRTYRTHRYQAALYGLLIQQTFDQPVHRAFLCYTRTHHQLETLPLTTATFRRAETILSEVREVLSTGGLPVATPYPNRCQDCCYRNICVQ